MKSLRIFSLLLCSSISAFSQTNSSFHDFEVRTILGDTISLSQFAGKKVMVVNTASFCSYTYQYGLLESLREQYSTAYNFEILGFPCNDFGNQEPGHDSTILEFCTNTYNVQFPMMSAIHIRTGDTAAVYKWLQRSELNGVSDAIVDWNFNKFLIDEDGNWVDHFTSTVSPFDTAIVEWITSDGISTRINEIPQEDLKIFNGPNNSIQLQYEGNSTLAQFNLYSIDGKLIQAKNFNLISGSQTLPLDNSIIKNGIYFVKITFENKLIHHPIVLFGSN